MADPLVSLVIPTHQRRESLRRALASLADQTAAAGSYEVVVSVDGSTDGTAEMIDSFEAPYALCRTAPERRGRAAACNAAVAAAAGEVLIVLDDDMEAGPELVERHAAHHPPGSRRCFLGAVPVVLDQASPRAAGHVKQRFDAHLARLSDPAHLARPRSFYTGNASLRTEVMRAVGGFDESFGIYGNEDVDLSLRLRRSGVELGYDPDAVAWQRYEKDFDGLQRDTMEKGRTTVLLARNHPGIFGELRLATPYENSRAWLVARAALLAATRRVPATAGAVFAAGSLLERAGLWRATLFYRAALDYAFWAGAAAALREQDDEGELAWLAGELQRGPIDLLLHR